MRAIFNTPVLLIAFNRPDTTKRVLESFEKVKPQKLYVAIDGPRESNNEDQENIKEVIKLTKNVNWDCETHYLIREKNLGCKTAVYEAISWALSKEDRLIIMEDDIISTKSFFYFAEELLERYLNDNRIAMISANNYTPISSMTSDYFFSNYGHIWGWATWKRVWDKFNVNLPELENEVKANFCTIDFLNWREKRYYKKYFTSLFHRLDTGKQDAWGPQFTFFRRYNHLLSIVPKFNLASNIGEISSRVDNREINNKLKESNYYKSHENFSIKNHPKKISLCHSYEKYHFNEHIFKNLNLTKRIIKKIKFSLI